jgi:uncharacterized spore protein YtfJ
MDIDAVIAESRETLGEGKVFGEPVERNGVTVIPVAKVSGGAGGGDDDSEGGGGAGFGIHARPAGALVIEADGSVEWRVPFDLNRVIMGGQAVAIAVICTVGMVLRALIKARARAVIAGAAIGRTAELVEQRLEN